MDKDPEIDDIKEVAKSASRKGKRTSGAVSAKGQISHNRITCISSCCGSKQVHHSKRSSDQGIDDDDDDEETREIEPVKIEKVDKSK